VNSWNALIYQRLAIRIAVDIDALIVLFLVAQFKIGIYAFWRLSKRLDKIERKNASIKRAIIGLHKKEFEDLRDSLHRINVSVVEGIGRSPAMDIIDSEAMKIEEDMWLRGETKK